jgi:hypothetical protein
VPGHEQSGEAGPDPSAVGPGSCPWSERAAPSRIAPSGPR